MGLRSLLRNVFRSRASREAAATSETADVPTEQGDSGAGQSDSGVERGDSPADVRETPEIPVSRGEFASITIVSAPIPVQTQSVPVRPTPTPTPTPAVSVEKPGEQEAAATEIVAGEAVADTAGEAGVATDVEDPPQGPPEVVPAPDSAPAPARVETASAAESGAGDDAVSDPVPARSAAAVPLARVEEVTPGLVGRYRTAAEAVRRCGLDGQRVSVYLVLDRSGSMRGYYKDGTVQHLADQTLALAGQLGEARVPVVFFSTDVDGMAELDLANHVGRIAELHASYGHMGRTNYHWAIAKVVEHHRASANPGPALVVFQTDGAPTARAAAARALCDAADLPIFWQFVGFGDPEGKGFDFLRKLDELTVPEQRAVDNAGFFHAGLDPRALPDAELYDQLLLELPEWLVEAGAAGVVVAPADALV